MNQQGLILNIKMDPINVFTDAVSEIPMDEQTILKYSVNEIRIDVGRDVSNEEYNKMKKVKWVFASSMIHVLDVTTKDILDKPEEYVFYATKVKDVSICSFDKTKIEMVFDGIRYNKKCFPMYLLTTDVIGYFYINKLTIDSLDGYSSDRKFEVFALDYGIRNVCDWCFGEFKTFSYNFHVCKDCNRIDRSISCPHKLSKNGQCKEHNQTIYPCDICKIVVHSDNSICRSE